MKFKPYELPEISTTDFADATDLNSAIALLNKLKGYVMEDAINMREQLNLMIQNLDREVQ